MPVVGKPEDENNEQAAHHHHSIVLQHDHQFQILHRIAASRLVVQKADLFHEDKVNSDGI